MSDCTVITPAVPGRGFLKRCVESVDSQTVPPAAHLIGIDYARTGHGARIRNALAEAASTTWIACCDDDDWFLPRHIELLMAATSDEVDVVMAEYRLQSYGWQQPHQCDPALFEDRNWVHPSSLLLRREAVLAVGGFPDPAPPLWDDWALLQNLHRARAKFACVHEITNIKGVHPGCICGPHAPDLPPFTTVEK